MRRPSEDMDERYSIFVGPDTVAYRTKFAAGTVKEDYYARKKYMLVDQEGKGSCVWIPVHRVKKDCKKSIRKAQKKIFGEREHMIVAGEKRKTDTKLAAEPDRMAQPPPLRGRLRALSAPVSLCCGQSTSRIGESWFTTPCVQ